MEKAIFGGGCFWCTEAVFKMLRGVTKVSPGYSGEPKAEVTLVEYDPEQIKYTDLLTVFFASHDPTTLNRQGNDIGTEYRSVIFYTTEEQKRQAGAYIHGIEGAVTELAPFSEFKEAEDYHKNYYATHPTQAYCQVIIYPKVEKVQKRFAKLLAQNTTHAE